MISISRHAAVLFCGIALCVVVAACGGDDSAPGASRKANPTSSELFDRSYGYLLRGDADFTRYAPNYSALRPFTRDTAMMVQTKSEHEKVTNAPAGYLEHFYVRIHRGMAVRMIVADSAGLGLISYEFPYLPEGEYTLGTKGWPKPQVDAIANNPFVYVYFVGDQRFRMRYKLGVDEKRHLTYMPQPALPG